MRAFSLFRAKCKCNISVAKSRRCIMSQQLKKTVSKTFTLADAELFNEMINLCFFILTIVIHDSLTLMYTLQVDSRKSRDHIWFMFGPNRATLARLKSSIMNLQCLVIQYNCPILISSLILVFVCCKRFWTSGALLIIVYIFPALWEHCTTHKHCFCPIKNTQFEIRSHTSFRFTYKIWYGFFDIFFFGINKGHVQGKWLS